MGGRIEVNSTVGQGSEFIVTVPLLLDKTQTDTTPGSADTAQDTTSGGIRVMLADPCEVNREYLLDRLAPFNVNAEVFATGEDILNAIKRATHTEHPCDIAVIDQSLLDQSPAEFAERVSVAAGTARPALVLQYPLGLVVSKHELIDDGFTHALATPHDHPSTR